MEAHTNTMISLREIRRKMFLFEGQYVLLACDASMIFQVSMDVLQALITKYRERLPEDLLIELSNKNNPVDKPQILHRCAECEISDKIFLFTEKGVAMLSCILPTQQAAEMNLQIIRLFIPLLLSRP